MKVLQIAWEPTNAAELADALSKAQYGDVIHLPPYEISIADTLRVPDGVTVKGQQGSVIKSSAYILFDVSGSANVAIEGFSIDYERGYAIRGVSCSNLDIKDVSFTGDTQTANSGGQAVRLEDSEGTTVEGCSLTHVFGGIYVTTSSDTVIRDNSLDEVSFGNIVVSGNDILVESNIINKPGYASIDGLANGDGITIGYSEGLQVLNNTITDGFCYGIWAVEGGTDVRFSGNEIVGGITSAIYLIGVNSGLIYNNVIRDNSYGLYLDNSSNLEIFENTFVRNNILVGQKSDNNVIARNDFDIISGDAVAGAALFNNSIHDNSVSLANSIETHDLQIAGHTIIGLPGGQVFSVDLSNYFDTVDDNGNYIALSLSGDQGQGQFRPEMLYSIGSRILNGALASDYGERVFSVEAANVRGSIARGELKLVAPSLSGVLQGSEESDDIYTLVGGLILAGGGGDDRITGSIGGESLHGDSGDDILIGISGADSYDGGDGIDTAVLDFSGTQDGISIDLADLAGIASAIGGTYFTSIEQLRVAGSDHNDVLKGGDLIDLLAGAGGDDELRGEGGDDVLSGGAGFDVLRGGAGNDVLVGGEGPNIFDGGDGQDVAVIDLSSANAGVDFAVDPAAAQVEIGEGSKLYSIEQIIVTGSKFDDRMLGGALADTLIGGAGSDFLAGGDGGDLLDGGDGDDKLNGASGDDVLAGGSGADLYDGGSGIDVAEVDYHAFTTPVAFSVSAGGAWSLTGGDDDVFIDVERIRLSTGAGNDTLSLGDLADWVSAGDGSDVVLGNGGADEILGGGGADRLDGGADDDIVHGGDGDDFLWSAEGWDRLFGEAGDDTFIPTAAFVDIYGGSGIDTVDYSSFGTNVTVSLPLDVGGVSSQHVLNSIERVIGSAFSDVIVGLSDVGEQFEGGDGDDTLIGQGGDDRLNGDAGNDVLDGGTGDDRLFGGTGVDQLYGGDGNDYLTVSGFSARLDGGAGYDTVDYSDFVQGVKVSLPKNTGGVGSGHELLSIEHVIGSAFGDLMVGLSNVGEAFEGGDGDDTLIGQGGDDILKGDAGNDVLDGGTGDDRLFGGTGVDQLYGGDGNDYLTVSGFSARLDGGAGYDTVDYSDFVQGVKVSLPKNTGGVGSGHELLSIEHVIGSAFGDLMVGLSNVGEAFEGGDGDDTLIGQGGDDILKGDAGNDVLDGGTGDDWIFGGAGDDTLSGGSGSDSFHFSEWNGNDMITDFEIARDVLDFSGAGLSMTDFTIGLNGQGDVQLTISSDGHGGTITLAGLSVIDLGFVHFLL